MSGDVDVVDVDAYMVQKIIGSNRRFVSPFREPIGYYVIGLQADSMDEEILNLYCNKLKYASVNADVLIQKAFHPQYFEFYGLNKKSVTSPDEMCRLLFFDSFVLDVKDKSIQACLTNDNFMFGHFIDCYWDSEWNVVYSYIC